MTLWDPLVLCLTGAMLASSTCLVPTFDDIRRVRQGRDQCHQLFLAFGHGPFRPVNGGESISLCIA